MPFGDFPATQPSGYYMVGLSSPSNVDVRFTLNGTPSIDPAQSPELEALLEQLHGALSPLGWTVNATEIADVQRQFEFPEPTEPEPAE